MKLGKEKNIYLSRNFPLFGIKKIREKEKRIHRIQSNISFSQFGGKDNKTKLECI